MSDSPYTTFPVETPRGVDPVEHAGNGAALHPQALTDRLAQGAHHTIDRLAETTAPHVQRLEEAVAGASQKLKEQARHAREAGDEWTADLRSTVRRRPLTAVATALAIGALLSRFLHTSR